MKLIGFYNEFHYQIFDWTDGRINEVLYEAGNSPHDSQVYVNPENGVGIETMREYCEQTLVEIADEHNAEIIGVQYDEDDANDRYRMQKKKRQL